MSYSAPTRVEIQTQGSIPWITLLVIFGFVIVFAWSSGTRLEPWTPHIGSVDWMKKNSYQVVNIYGFFKQSDWTRLLLQLPCAAMASFATWQLLANMYFIWVFGAKVEQRLGSAYFGLIFAGLYLPWGIVQFDRFKVLDDTYYYGSLFLVSMILGASMIFPKHREINTQWVKSARGEIFNRQQNQDPTRKYDKRDLTQLWLIAYIAYQVGCYFYSVKLTPGFTTFHLGALIFSVIFGYALTWFLVWSATGDFQDGALKLMCIRRYNTVLKLDVGHDAAVKETARSLALPEERVREWVARQKGKMKIS